MGRSRREYPQGRLRLKYNKSNYDTQKEYTLYYEYTWLDDAWKIHTKMAHLSRLGKLPESVAVKV